jgi:hypothetical protein
VRALRNEGRGGGELRREEPFRHLRPHIRSHLQRAQGGAMAFVEHCTFLYSPILNLFFFSSVRVPHVPGQVRARGQGEGLPRLPLGQRRGREQRTRLLANAAQLLKQ